MVQKKILHLQTVFPILLSFLLFCVVCVYSSETLASLWQVNVLAVLCPELPNHGSTVSVMGKLQMALPYEELYQMNR